MSRGGIPFNKRMESRSNYKQVCIYGFGREHLQTFAKQKQKTENEEIEDIEILRFVDLDIPVQMLQVSEGSIAVDTPEDLDRVRRIFEDKSEK